MKNRSGAKRNSRYEYRLRWDEVHYQPGALRVVAYKNGSEWATKTVHTTGEATRIELVPDRKRIHADGHDLCFVTARLLDSEGRFVPTANSSLKFSVSGPAEIIATDNGDRTDLTAFPSLERNAFNGLCLAIVRGNQGAAGVPNVTASCGDLRPGTTTIEVSP